MIRGHWYRRGEDHSPRPAPLLGTIDLKGGYVLGMNVWAWALGHPGVQALRWGTSTTARQLAHHWSWCQPHRLHVISWRFEGSGFRGSGYGG